jgi:hypothetical protein
MTKLEATYQPSGGANWSQPVTAIPRIFDAELFKKAQEM